MKKKFAALLLASILTISSCGSVDTQTLPEDAETEMQTKTSTEEDISDLDSLGDIEVEKNLFIVNLTIPADYVGETTQEELDQTAEENGYKSITLNDDGSATYIMTKAQHKEMMNDIESGINSSLNDLVQSEDYPNFTDITTNSDYTEFTITTTSSELNMTESFSTITFYMYGGMYAIFNGTEVDNIHVDFVNADTGEIISSSDSSDMTNAE